MLTKRQRSAKQHSWSRGCRINKRQNSWPLWSLHLGGRGDNKQSNKHNHPPKKIFCTSMAAPAVGQNKAGKGTGSELEEGRPLVGPVCEGRGSLSASASPGAGAAAYCEGSASALGPALCSCPPPPSPNTPTATKVLGPSGGECVEPAPWQATIWKCSLGCRRRE